MPSLELFLSQARLSEYVSEVPPDQTATLLSAPAPVNPLPGVMQLPPTFRQPAVKSMPLAKVEVALPRTERTPDWPAVPTDNPPANVEVAVVEVATM